MEQEWLTSTNPATMLRWLRDGPSVGQSWQPISDRKLRLWVEACRREEEKNLRPEFHYSFTGGFAIETSEGLQRAVRAWSEDIDVVPCNVLADLLRHIVGNPWNPVIFNGGSDFVARPKGSEAQRRPASHLDVCGPLPAVVLSLAQNLYDGEDAAFALHDALLEIGQDKLAEHFCESVHPKGCHVLDAILGKE